MHFWQRKLIAAPDGRFASAALNCAAAKH